MTEQDILKLRDTAEQTRVQFKERVTRDNKYDVSCEMVALSNSRGGMIVVGKYPQRWLPAFTTRCVSFVGNSIGGTEFRDKSLEVHARHQVRER